MPPKTPIERKELNANLAHKKKAIERICNLVVKEKMKENKSFNTLDVAKECIQELKNANLADTALLLNINMFVATILKHTYKYDFKGEI